MRKKLFALALATTAVLTFAACGSDGNTSSNNSNNTTASTPSSSAASTPSSSAETPSSSAEVASASLEDWFKDNTSDVSLIEDSINSQIAGSGFTVKLNADGNVFVYEYYLDELLDTSLLSADDMAALDESFAEMVEQQRSNLDTMFSTFEQAYDIKMDAIRCVFYNADNTELYTGEVKNN